MYAQINKFMFSLDDARRRLLWNAFSHETYDMISAVSSIIMLCSSNKANRCEPSTSWPSSCLIVVRSCFMSSCIRAITHLGLHIVALKVFEMSSLLNFHVCWYAHFILILLTQTAGHTSVNKKAANHFCFWFGFFKLLMISAVYNSKLLQIHSFTLIEADHQHHLIFVYCHRYKLKPYYMMPNVIS